MQQHEPTAPWHVQPVDQVLAALGTDPADGLSAREAAARLERHGENRLPEGPGVSPWQILAAQFREVIVLVLLGAAGLSFLLDELADGLAILAILLLNALLGFLQEYRAERALEALKGLVAPTCRVVRSGAVHEMPAAGVVPGDLVLLEAGDRVPADLRLLEAHALSADESALTGESAPVEKDPAWRGRGGEPPGDRRNMLFMGCVVTRGRARGVVVATGPDAEIGRIASLIRAAAPEPSPLQERLRELGTRLVGACLATVAVVVAIGVLRGFDPYRMFLTGVSLAVAAIPEGLPAVVTIALALGVQRMSRRGAVIRRLPAVETLGSATVICSDKTGTLTQNRMTVREIRLAHARVEVGESPGGLRNGLRPSAGGTGWFSVGGRPVPPSDTPGLLLALRIGTLCNHARLVLRGRHRGGCPSVQGDPTEAALLLAAHQAGLPEAALPLRPVVAELPFDSERKRMSVVVRGPEGLELLLKGAPDLVIPRATHFWTPRGPVPLTQRERERWLAATAEMSRAALRVIALAYRPWEGPPRRRLEPADEQNLILVGLAGLGDPPRPEVRQAIQVARRAGVRTLMITGDHRETALAVARQLDLVTGDGDRVLTGPELEALTDEELIRRVEEVDVFARVSPQQKLRIVRALRARRHVVAMTGDGVNDAPAVREADIGVAMGRGGTQVTKEAAAMVLTDDNYATIVAAIEEGRGIYQNIRKFIRYLLGCNVGEILTMLGATLLGMPLPLLPLQILWVNLVTDGLPAIALGVDPPERDLMSLPPRPRSESLFAGGLAWRILLRGLFIAAVTLLVFVGELLTDPAALERARTLAFCTLVVAQLLFVFQCRSERRTVLEMGLWENPQLVAAVAGSLAMQLAVVYTPPLQAVFETVPLGPGEWAVALAFAGLPWVGDALHYLAARLWTWGVAGQRRRGAWP